MAKNQQRKPLTKKGPTVAARAKYPMVFLWLVSREVMQLQVYRR
jgi:hypothetical protein